MMIRTDLDALLARFQNLRVIVAGDLMVDEYVWGHVTRVSPEAPVPVVDAESHTFVPGGAANVAHNLRALGATVFVAGAIGDDATGRRLRDELSTLGIDTSALIVADDRPTTQKTRIVAGSQQVVRVDREKRTPLPTPTAGRLVDVVSGLLPGCNALLFSDYDKGVLGRDTVRALIACARKADAVVTANPKPASARFYADVDIAQLNRTEAEQASGVHLGGVSGDTFHAIGTRLRAQLNVRNLLITRGAQGLTLFGERDSFTDIAAHHVEVFDGTGAGDSTIAALTLALAAGAGPVDAARIGNAAGGAVVRKVGVVTATPAEIATLFP